MAFNKKRVASGVLGLVLGMMAFPSWAGESLPADMLSRLAAEQFGVREKAQVELLDWSRQRKDKAVAELIRQSREADEPEVRQRCLAVLRELANDDFLMSGEGYVGITMQDEIASVPGDAIPRSVIRVGQLLPGTAGDQAGLKAGDLIVGLDDDVWRNGPASLPFGEKVRKLKPGTKVSLKIMRDDKLLSLDLKLGKRPVAADLFLMGPTVDLEALEKQAKEDFFRQWMNQRKVPQPAAEKP